MKCVVYRSVLVWSSALLLFLLAACGGDAGPDYSNQEGVEVSIFASLGRTSTGEQASLSSQGVPVDPTTGKTGVDTAELEVYSGETRLFFSEGRLVDEAEGESVILTPEDSEVSLFLPQGNYRFALSAFDEQNNVLAKGQVEQQIGAESRVSVPLTSLIGSARFKVPESVTANAVFDAFLEVSPPNRPDLRVPLGDFSVSYEVKEPSVQLEGSSNVGVRVAAACDVVEVTATVDNDLSEEVNASASVPVNDEACEGAGGGSETPVGADLVPPFVSIKTPEANSTLNTTFTLQGDVNDQQSGVDKVEVYEGTVKLGEANIDSDSMMWSFDASLEEGSYTLIAVAFDKAGNSSRAEVRVRVEEGAGGGDEGDGNGDPQVCTNPVEIPNQFLERAIRDALGKQGGELTCEDLASLTELRVSPGTGAGDVPVTVESLEGLQYASNLEMLTISGVYLEDFSQIRGLKRLKVLELFDLVDPNATFEPLRMLTNLETFSASGRGGFSVTIEDLTPLANLTKLTRLSIGGLLYKDGISDLTPLQNLTNLVSLSLNDNPGLIGEVNTLDFLRELSDLETLELVSTGTRDLSALQDLSELNDLDLRFNDISDITPLVENNGLGAEDSIQLSQNELDTCPGTEDREDIEALLGRGVSVDFDNPQDCDVNGGDNGQTCTSPVNVPDENLRQTLKDTLGLGESDPITCEALAGLTEFFQIGTDENDNLVEISTLEGLQFATNLEVIDIRDAVVDDISAVFELPKLQKLSITSLEACSSEAFQAEIERLTERGVEVEIALIGSCSDTTCTNPVEIPNEALEATIRAELGLAEGTTITCEDLANLSELRYGAEENFSEDNTELLEGLQYAVNLKRLGLRLRINPLTSEVFAPLENLTILETINLSIPVDTEDEGVLSFLDDFTTLRALSVEPALVDDPEGVIGPTLDLSPLGGLTNLTNLRLSYIDFTDLSPLQNLSNLTDLIIEVNQGIGDISALENLSALTNLQLDGASVNDLDALEGLTNLTSLDLLLEELSDIDALRNLSNLMNLFLAAPVDDIRPLQNLSNLSDLTLLVPVSDISPLQNLSSLTRLSFGGEAFSDVSPLQNLSNLTDLDLSSNEISDITPLQDLPNLTGLDLRGNNISEITPLQNLTGLTGLFLGNNPLGNDISVLQNLSKLVSLDLASTGLSDISVLEDLTNLAFLELSFNEISDISALVANEGLGLSNTNEGDQVFLRDNPLSPQALEDVETLEARFVVVTL